MPERSYFAWITVPRLLLVAGALVFTALVWPESGQSDPMQDAGVRAAKAALRYRKAAEADKRELAEARKRIDSAFSYTRRQIMSMALARRIDTVPVVLVDGHPIMGPHAETDTLMALPYVRGLLAELRDTALVGLASVEETMQVERGRASLAIQHLEATVANQDTVIAALKAARVPWPTRAIRGVEHLGAGVGLGAVGYVIGGPLAGLGGAILGAAIGGVFR